jgi:hypothetical protein
LTGLWFYHIIKAYTKEQALNYTLIKPDGTEMKFYLRSVAELYQTINGGRIVGVPQLKLVDKLAA